MRAITYESFGTAADVLVLRDLEKPRAGPGEVLVRLATSAANPSDVKARAGGRPGVTKPPFATIIPHSDGAGIIEAVGEGVPALRIGERVWIWNGQWQRAFGTAAEYISLPAGQAVLLPSNVSFEEGAVLGIPGLTACHAVLGQGSVEGKTVLVGGGAGTVGHLAVQVAAASGAKVIATAGTNTFEAVKTAGATHVFDYASEDLASQILDANDGKPIDHVVEVEFGRNIGTIADTIAERGSISAYGSAQDMTPSLPFYPLMFKAVRMELLLVYLLSPKVRQQAIESLTRLLIAERLNIRIAETFDLSECATAHDRVAQGQRQGAVILNI